MSGADDALRVLCEGEPWALDRGTEHLLLAVADAMSTDWTPSVAGLPDERRARVGYLLVVLRDGLPRVRSARWGAWLAALKAGLRSGTVETHDDLAKEWGLPRGLDVLRVRRVLRGGWR